MDYSIVISQHTVVSYTEESVKGKSRSLARCWCELTMSNRGRCLLFLTEVPLSKFGYLDLFFYPQHALFPCETKSPTKILPYFHFTSIEARRASPRIQKNVNTTEKQADFWSIKFDKWINKYCSTNNMLCPILPEHCRSCYAHVGEVVCYNDINM